MLLKIKNEILYLYIFHTTLICTVAILAQALSLRVILDPLLDQELSANKHSPSHANSEGHVRCQPVIVPTPKSFVYSHGCCCRTTECHV